MQTPAANTHPLVSIIMPTYNRAGYILETIDCITAQTYINWELIVLDDGSVDDTEIIVKNITDNRIRYYKFQRTAITGKLKNFGIRESKGELIAFMDSDDIWPAGKLEKQMKALLAFPNAGFSFTNGFNFSIPFNPDVFFYERKDGMECRNIFIDQCTTRIGIRTPTLLFWKNCIEKTGPFNENRLFTDYSFISRLAYYFDALIMYESLFFRRIHPGNNNFSINGYQDYQEYFETIELFIQKEMLSANTVCNAMFTSHIAAGDHLVVAGHQKKARIHYFKAWKHNLSSFAPIKRIIKSYLY